MPYEISINIPKSHPSIPGHFPGHPIVPGVVILDHVFSALKQWRGEIELASLPSVKFLHPIFPDMTFTIAFENTENNRYRFLCLNGEQTLVSGEFRTV